MSLLICQQREDSELFKQKKCMSAKSKTDNKKLSRLIRKSIRAEYKKDFTRAFHCINCGRHPLVIHQTWIKGFEKSIVTRVVLLEMDKPKEIYKTGTLSGEGESVEMLTCGICGVPGHLDSIPKIFAAMDDEIDM